MNGASTMGMGVVVALLALILASPVHAQTFSTADLAGTWEVFQLGTPKGQQTGAAIRTYRGEVTFDATGATLGLNPITDNDPNSGGNVFSAVGRFSVSIGAVVTGQLVLTNIAPAPDAPLNGTLVVREARLLANRHTIVGAANVSVSGEVPRVGLFTFSKREDGQTFSFADLGGDTTRDWNYHAVTPSNSTATTNAPGGVETSAWVSGSITFHGTDSIPGCTEADLALSDGTVVAQRSAGDPTSFQ